MLTIESIDPTSKKQAGRFVNLPYRLYARQPYWTPPLLADAHLYLNQKNIPFTSIPTPAFLSPGGMGGMSDE